MWIIAQAIEIRWLQSALRSIIKLQREFASVSDPERILGRTLRRRPQEVFRSTSACSSIRRALESISQKGSRNSFDKRRSPSLTVRVMDTTPFGLKVVFHPQSAPRKDRCARHTNRFISDRRDKRERLLRSTRARVQNSPLPGVQPTCLRGERRHPR